MHTKLWRGTLIFLLFVQLRYNSQNSVKWIVASHTGWGVGQGYASTPPAGPSCSCLPPPFSERRAAPSSLRQGFASSFPYAHPPPPSHLSLKLSYIRQVEYSVTSSPKDLLWRLFGRALYISVQITVKVRTKSLKVIQNELFICRFKWMQGLTLLFGRKILPSKKDI